MMVFTTAPGIAQWFNNSIVSVTSSTATSSITTTVVGVATNAYHNPIDLNGQLYATPGGNAPYPITSFNSGPITSTPTSTTLESTVSISAGGFVPGDYACFQVTITNTGSTTLQFTNYQILDEFVDSSGASIPYAAPAYDNLPGFYAAADPLPVTGTWTITPVSGTGFDAVASNTAGGSPVVPSTSGTEPIAGPSYQT